MTTHSDLGANENFDILNDQMGAFRGQVAPIRARQWSGSPEIIEGIFRRGIDVVGAILCLILFFPVALVVAILVSLDGGSVFYAHQRVGQNGINFCCWKFRTMVANSDASIEDYLAAHPAAQVEWERKQKLTADPRITRVGAFLRKWSLDEIPQMWNVLVGQMSLVGPRPVTPMEMCERYGSAAEVVTTVRPGITGPWQISGRSEINYEVRVKLDVRYVESRSLVLDLYILLLTIPAVLRQTGAR